MRQLFLLFPIIFSSWAEISPIRAYNPHFDKIQAKIDQSFQYVNDENLHQIDLSHEYLGNLGVAHLVKKMKGNLAEIISSVVLRDCNLGDENALAVLEGMGQLGSRYELCLAMNGISALGCKNLLLTTKSCSGLSMLDLSLNPLGGGCGQIGALQPLPVLMKEQKFPCASLRLAYCGLDVRNCRMLASALAKAGTNGTLTHLDLTGNPLGDDGATALASCLKQGAGCGLQSLVLAKCKISDRGADALATALKSAGPGSTLKHLDLSYNKIQSEGAASFGLSLRHGCSLESLKLSYNPLGDEGVRALALGLVVRRARQRGKGRRAGSSSPLDKNDTKLSTEGKGVDQLKLVDLYLRGVGLSVEGARGLARALRTNPPLKKLDLSGNRDLALSEKNVKQGALKETMSSVKSLTNDLKKTKVTDIMDLQKLQVISNKVKGEGLKIAGKLISSATEEPEDIWNLCGARQLFMSLQQNTHLEHLGLCATGMEPDVLFDMIKVIQGDENKSVEGLKSVDIRMNSIPKDLVSTVSKLLQVPPEERHAWDGLNINQRSMDGENDMHEFEDDGFTDRYEKEVWEINGEANDSEDDFDDDFNYANLEQNWELHSDIEDYISHNSDDEFQVYDSEDELDISSESSSDESMGYNLGSSSKIMDISSEMDEDAENYDDDWTETDENTDSSLL